MLILVVILPVSADNDEYFDSWYLNYYDSQNSHLDNLNITTLNQDEFLELNYIYQDVYSEYNQSQIKEKMIDDFKKNDLDNDGFLGVNEFEEFFTPIYEYYLDSDDYEFYMQSDLNNDSLISQEEFEEISHVFSEDSFWDGFSIEEITQSEFDNANSNGDDFLNFTEFKTVV